MVLVKGLIYAFYDMIMYMKKKKLEKPNDYTTENRSSKKKNQRIRKTNRPLVERLCKLERLKR